MDDRRLFKITKLLLILALVLTQTGMAVLILDDARTAADVNLLSGGFSPISGLASGGGVSLAYRSGVSAPLSRQDYEAAYAKANEFLKEGIDFRTSDDMVIDSPLLNPPTYTDWAPYYEFCDNYDQIDSQGLCPEEDGRKNVRNNLLHARQLYGLLFLAPSDLKISADGKEIKAREIGAQGVISATREVVNVHMIFGNEFLIDASDYNFAESSDTPDEIIQEELALLDLAQQQFQLAMGLVLDGLYQTLGSQVREAAQPERWIGELFSSREFELFGMASNRLMSTLSERAKRYLILGQEDKAKQIYQQAYTEQYMQALALAQKAEELGQDYLVNGSWEILSNLSLLRSRAQAVDDGIDPFGFTAEYVPIQALDTLLEVAWGKEGDGGLLKTCENTEDAALEAKREYDQIKNKLTTEIANLKDEYNSTLFDICGESQDDYATCEGGLMEQNQMDMYAASLRIGQAWMEAENIATQIKLEEERVGRVIAIELLKGQEISAAELAIGKLEAFKQSHTQIASSEDQVYDGVESTARAYVQVEAKISINPLNNEASATSGLELAVQGTTGYQHSETWSNSTETLWDPNAEKIGDWNSIKALKEAESAAAIEGANSEAVIRNLLLLQSELLIDYDLAGLEFNKLAAEHNHLAQRYNRALNGRAQADDDVLQVNSHIANPAYRIMRDSLILQAVDDLNKAAQYAYLAGKALEYYNLLPVTTENYSFGVDDIYKARKCSDVRNFLENVAAVSLIKLEPQVYVSEISIAKHILGLSDQNLNPDGDLTPEQVNQLRYERFQEFLQRYTNVVDHSIYFVFPTSLELREAATQYIFSTNIWGNRISEVRLDIHTRQTGDVGKPEVNLTHGGQASYRDPRGETVYYDPGPAVPVGFKIPDELAPAETTITLIPDINGQGAIPNTGLKNFSVATSRWIFQIPGKSSGYLDFSQIEDFVIHVDSRGIALSGFEQQALEDAARSQVGLGMAPVIREPFTSIPETADITPSDFEMCKGINGDGLSGCYFGSLILKSPLDVGIQVMNIMLEDKNGVLTGETIPSPTAFYTGTFTLNGSTDGATFELTSNVVTATMWDHEVQLRFTLDGVVTEDGEILTGDYVGMIENYMNTPIKVQGSYSSSRPSLPGGIAPLNGIYLPIVFMKSTN